MLIEYEEVVSGGCTLSETVQRERSMNMWLLKLHFSISILILITFLGFRWACKEQVIKNGWIDGKAKKKRANYLAFFVPFLNVVMLIAFFIMVGVTKEDFEKMKEGKNSEKV